MSDASPARPASASIHANAVVVGETGVLIRGASGSGKSELAHALVGEAQRRGLFARLVGDDRIRLVVVGARLAARPHPLIAGMLERRGIGIVAVEHEPAAILRIVVDLDAGLERMPEETSQIAELHGVKLPRLHLAIGQPVLEQARRILDRVEVI